MAAADGPTPKASPPQHRLRSRAYIHSRQSAERFQAHWKNPIEKSERRFQPPISLRAASAQARAEEDKTPQTPVACEPSVDPALNPAHGFARGSKRLA